MTHNDVKPVEIAVVPDELPMERELRRQEDTSQAIAIEDADKKQDGIPTNSTKF